MFTPAGLYAPCVESVTPETQAERFKFGQYDADVGRPRGDRVTPTQEIQSNYFSYKSDAAAPWRTCDGYNRKYTAITLVTTLTFGCEFMLDERGQQRTVEQIVDVPVHRSGEGIAETVQTIPFKRISECIVEQSRR